MSPAVCETPLPSTAFLLDGLGLGGDGGRARCGDLALSAGGGVGGYSPEAWLAQQEAAIQREAAEKKDGQFDIWASIQSSKQAAAPASPPYVHPLVRRSASSLSQKSLEICTESLGSETGSDGVLFSGDLGDSLPWKPEEEEAEEEEEEEFPVEMQTQEEGVELPHQLAETTPPPAPERKKELAAVNYHCSNGRWSSPPRSFPPPLSSLSRRDGPCLSMRPHRRDGRLVVEAVSVPSQNYLHARRHGGRLLLTLVETTFREIYPETEEPAMQLFQKQGTGAAETGEGNRGLPESVADGEEDEEGMEEEEEEEEGEEEVEVVDRGIVVEVKVSRPPQPQTGGVKVQRSSVVINKFVGVPSTGRNSWADTVAAAGAPPRVSGAPTTTTTATAVVAAAAAASSSRSGGGAGGARAVQRSTSPEKLFFTSKRQMKRQDLLHQVRRCSEHLRPYFIWEPCCIATS